MHRKQRSRPIPHLHTVAAYTIPTHELEHGSDDPARVEHIVPVDSPVHNEVHRHDYDELFFFATGGGTHMIDLEQHTVVAPGVHLVGAGQVHQLSRTADMRAVVVQFGQEALLGLGGSVHGDLFSRMGRPCSVPLNADQVNEAIELVTRIEKELGQGGAVMKDVVRGYLSILLIKCAQWVRESKALNTPPLEEHDPVRRFQDLVERGYLEERQVAHYADKLAISADHLNELVKKRLGRTASAVIHDRLLLEAKRLLLHSERSVKEVGYLLNMKDPAYFSRWFGKAEGMTPVAYREHVREKYQH
jgi:AraC family transcriptional regulator, transcriptional activator of pobA